MFSSDALPIVYGIFDKLSQQQKGENEGNNRNGICLNIFVSEAGYMVGLLLMDLRVFFFWEFK